MGNVYEYVSMSMSMCMNTCTFVCMCTKVREWVPTCFILCNGLFVTVTLIYVTVTFDVLYKPPRGM